MKVYENITSYFLRVDEIVNTLRGIGETILTEAIVQNVLRSLPIKFDSKVSVLEDRKDLDMVTMDEIHGILTSYEMRTENENPSRREAYFKVSKKTKRKQEIFHQEFFLRNRS